MHYLLERLLFRLRPESYLRGPKLGSLQRKGHIGIPLADFGVFGGSLEAFERVTFSLEAFTAACLPFVRALDDFDDEPVAGRPTRRPFVTPEPFSSILVGGKRACKASSDTSTRLCKSDKDCPAR